LGDLELGCRVYLEARVEFRLRGSRVYGVRYKVQGFMFQV